MATQSFQTSQKLLQHFSRFYWFTPAEMKSKMLLNFCLFYFRCATWNLRKETVRKIWIKDIGTEKKGSNYCISIGTKFDTRTHIERSRKHISARLTVTRSNILICYLTAGVWLNHVRKSCPNIKNKNVFIVCVRFGKEFLGFSAVQLIFLGFISYSITRLRLCHAAKFKATSITAACFYDNLHFAWLRTVFYDIIISSAF